MIARLAVVDRKPSLYPSVSIVIEEADESCYWLELIIEGELLAKDKVEALLDKANQITAIMDASQKTANGDR